MADLGVARDTLIVIPTYNEEKNIVETIRQLKRSCIDFIIVDGYSLDNTAKLAAQENIHVHSRTEHGKSSAITYGLEYARNNGYEYIAYCDADLSYSLDQLVELINKRFGYDMVIGMRDYKNMSFQRRVGNSVANIIFQISFGVKNIDAATGMRVLRVNAFSDKIYSKEFNVEAEIWIIAFLNSLKIARYNISYIPGGRKSNFNLLHYISGLLYILRKGFLVRGNRFFVALGIKS